jgi:hypothetical protein
VKQREARSPAIDVVVTAHSMAGSLYVAGVLRPAAIVTSGWAQRKNCGLSEGGAQTRDDQLTVNRGGGRSLLYGTIQAFPWRTEEDR